MLTPEFLYHLEGKSLKSKTHISPCISYPFCCLSVYRTSFWCGLQSWYDIDIPQRCLLLSIMELNVTLACGAESSKKHIWKMFLNIAPRLKVIQRLCCERFKVGTILSLPNRTRQPYHSTEGSMHLLRDMRFSLIRTQVINSNGVCCNVSWVTSPKLCSSHLIRKNMCLWFVTLFREWFIWYK